MYLFLATNHKIPNKLHTNPLIKLPEMRNRAMAMPLVAVCFEIGLV